MVVAIVNITLNVVMKLFGVILAVIGNKKTEDNEDGD